MMAPPFRFVMVVSCSGCLVAVGVLLAASRRPALSDTLPSTDSRSSSSLQEASTSPAPVSSSPEDYEYDYDHDHDAHFHAYPNITFTRILFWCEYLFSARFGSYSGLVHTMLFRNTSIFVVGEERFVHLCREYHIHRKCEEKPFITSCLGDDVVFLHDHGCTKPSPHDAYFDVLLAATLLEDDEACFEAVCGGEVRVVMREVEGLTVHLFSPVTQHGACHKYLLPYYPAQDRLTLTIRNVHWPSCFAGYEVVWSLEPGSDGGGGGGVIKTWSYLPPHCRALEHVLAVVVGLVVVGGVAGNVLVLVLCAWRGHFTEPSTVLCVSTAAAELLVCVFVLAPALHAHLRPMHDEAPADGSSLKVSGGAGTRRLLDVGLEEVEGGFLMFSAHVLNTGLAVSLPTVLLLALEQSLAGTGWSLQEELTWRRTRGFVVASWSVGVLLSLALVHGGGAFWYSFYKLPLAVPPGRAGMVLTGAAVVLGAVVGMTVVVFFVSIWRTLKGGAVRRRLILEIAKAFLHVVTAGTGVAALMLPLGGTSVPRLELAHFLCWWGFLSSVCWHPWLLCLPRRDVRGAVMALVGERRHPWLERLLALGSWVGDAATPSPPPSPRPPSPPRHKLAPGRRHRYLPGVRYYR